MLKRVLFIPRFKILLQLCSRIVWQHSGLFWYHHQLRCLSDNKAWQAAVQPNARMFYLETSSNPLTEVADIRAIGKIANKANALFTVDNCFCTPALQAAPRLLSHQVFGWSGQGAGWGHRG